MWSLNRGGLIIEVVAHTGLTVHNCILNDFLPGVFTETIDSPLFQVKTRVFAHRNLTRLLVLEIELTRHSAVPVTLKLKNFGGSFSSQDLSPGIKDSGIKGVE